jgi:hypothetical protein
MDTLYKNVTVISRKQNPSGSNDLHIKAIDGKIFIIENCLSPEKTLPVEKLFGAYDVEETDGTLHHKKAILYYNADRTKDLELTDEEY